MPRTKKKTFGKFNFFDSYPTLILGAIIVIVLGLLTANFFTKRNQEIGGGEKISIPAEEQIRTQGGDYKVAEGDSLSTISQKIYGSEDFWPVLARANNLTDPNVIYADSTLKAPSRENAEEIKTNMTVTRYEIEEGDTLFLIAEKVYGDGSAWPTLARANSVGYLPNGNPLIFAGNTLIIPR